MMTFKLFILSFTCLFVLVQTVSASINLDIKDNTVYYIPGQSLNGSVTIIHDEFIFPSAILSAYIDDNFVFDINLSDYLHDISYYSFIPQYFKYNITAYGVNNWTEYPNQRFDYILAASGTCGNEECSPNCDCDNLCSSPYPCEWSLETIEFESRVNANEGLKYIRDASNIITPPPDNNKDTYWYVYSASEQIEVTMRAACGGQRYMTFSVFDDGWVRRTINIDSECSRIGVGRECNIEPFDHHSLDIYRNKYADKDVGGIYKDGVYLTASEVEWNGSTGYIWIKYYDDEAVYTINYLPPNGPMLCAYTNYTIQNSSSWTKNKTISGSSRYNDIYKKQYTDDELEQLLPAPSCPLYVDSKDCDQNTYNYTVVEVSDPSNSVDIDFDGFTKTVTAITSSLKLDKNYSSVIDFDGFTDLKAPETTGFHNLTLNITYQDSLLSAETVQFITCADNDKDGYCEETGDCNDKNPKIYPGAVELCNDINDDCDDETDEGFIFIEGMDEKKKGELCYYWEASMCAGFVVCTEDGLNVTCNGTYQPGELKEICNNQMDDDCDGKIDEDTEQLANGTWIIGCGCMENEKKPCGSNIGACEEGYSVCINNEWSDCIDKKIGQDEICNQIDDDCDGIVDDVDEGNSIETTKCGCYNNGLPTTEICNQIDDDCDGEVDEGIVCCKDGDTQPCGSDVGVCERGVQLCINGSWNTPCLGGIQPKEEVCYDKLDNNCDGEVDEYCIPDVTCKNNIQDLNEDGVDCGGVCQRQCQNLLPWIIMAVIAIVCIVTVTLLQLRGKI